MKSDTVILAKENTRQMVITSGRDVVLHVINNPLMQLALFVAFVEVCQMIRPDGKHQVISDTTGSAMEGVAISADGIKMLAGAVGAALPQISEIANLIRGPAK